MTKGIAAWLMIASALAAPATPGTPRDVVQTAVGRVLAALPADGGGRPAADDPAARAAGERRRVEMRRVAADLFDFEEMAQRALSRHWAARTAAEQAEFVRLFTDLLERTYVGRIEAYAGERIVYVGDIVTDGYATVRTRIVTKRRTETALDYRLHRPGPGPWKVYDVLVDGVSFVATYRSQFDRVIQEESYAALVERLRRRALDVAVGRDGRS
jgi:phospholipid transport system substrate-binding protein